MKNKKQKKKLSSEVEGIKEKVLKLDAKTLSNNPEANAKKLKNKSLPFADGGIRMADGFTPDPNLPQNRVLGLQSNISTGLQGRSPYEAGLVQPANGTQSTWGQGDYNAAIANSQTGFVNNLQQQSMGQAPSLSSGIIDQAKQQALSNLQSQAAGAHGVNAAATKREAAYGAGQVTQGAAQQQQMNQLAQQMAAQQLQGTVLNQQATTNLSPQQLSAEIEQAKTRAAASTQAATSGSLFGSLGDAIGGLFKDGGVAKYADGDPVGWHQVQTGTTQGGAADDRTPIMSWVRDDAPAPAQAPVVDPGNGGITDWGTKEQNANIANRQTQLVNELNARSSGSAPSLAQAQMKAAYGQNLAQQLGAVGGARGQQSSAAVANALRAAPSQNVALIGQSGSNALKQQTEAQNQAANIMNQQATTALAPAQNDAARQGAQIAGEAQIQSAYNSSLFGSLFNLFKDGGVARRMADGDTAPAPATAVDYAKGLGSAVMGQYKEFGPLNQAMAFGQDAKQMIGGDIKGGLSSLGMQLLGTEKDTAQGMQAYDIGSNVKSSYDFLKNGIEGTKYQGMGVPGDRSVSTGMQSPASSTAPTSNPTSVSPNKVADVSSSAPNMDMGTGASKLLGGNTGADSMVKASNVETKVAQDQAKKAAEDAGNSDSGDYYAAAANALAGGKNDTDQASQAYGIGNTIAEIAEALAADGAVFAPVLKQKYTLASKLPTNMTYADVLAAKRRNK